MTRRCAGCDGPIRTAQPSRTVLGERVHARRDCIESVLEDDGT